MTAAVYKNRNISNQITNNKDPRKFGKGCTKYDKLLLTHPIQLVAQSISILNLFYKNIEKVAQPQQHS